jgi:hypothetical protein
MSLQIPKCFLSVFKNALHFTKTRLLPQAGSSQLPSAARMSKQQWLDKSRVASFLDDYPV